MKKALIFVMIIAVIMSSLALIGCKNETPENNEENQGEVNPNVINLLKNGEGDEWIDENYVDTDKNNPYRGLASFTLSEGDNALAVIKSHKYNEYDALSKDVDQYDLSEFKKLTITLSGSGDFVLSITSNPIIPGGAGFSEVTFALTEESKTYEFDLSFPAYEAVRKGIKKVTIIPNAGQKGEELADVKITSFEFSKEDVNSALVCNTEAFDVDNPNIYDGTSDTFNINKNFGSNDGAYIVTWGEGTTLIELTENKLEWSYVKSPVTGNLQSFTKLYIKFKGEEGMVFKLKLESTSTTAYETGSANTQPDIVCDGTEQEFELTGFTAANLVGSDDASMWVLIFVEPGEAGGAGEKLEILSFEFRK